MGATRLIPFHLPARTPTPEPTPSLRRLDAPGRAQPGHFAVGAADRTLCGLDLPDARPAVAVHCPRCLALALPGQRAGGDGQ
jgi:hypothetical protein